MITTLLASAVLAQQSPKTIEWPFKIMDSAIIVDSVVNGKKVSCMFDTGFSGAYVLNESVNVGKATGTMTLQDFVGAFQAETVDIKSIQMGEVKIPSEGMTVVKMGNQNYSMSYGTHVDGIMGLEPLSHEIFQINFEKSKFVFYPKDYDITKIPVDGKTSWRLKILPIGNNVIKLPVEAPNGQKMYLSLDTGNGFYSTTHKDVLERVGMWKTGTKPNFMKASWVASGPVASWDILMSDMKIYGVPVKEAVWNIIDLPSSSSESDGTVGFGFLKNFNITIDIDRRLVVLQNFSGKQSDPVAADVGLRAIYSPRDQRMFIFNVTPGGPADKAGIKRGDFLLGLNGEFLGNVSFNALESMLEGEAGTKVDLSVSRNGVLERYSLTREVMVNKPMMSE